MIPTTEQIDAFVVFVQAMLDEHHKHYSFPADRISANRLSNKWVRIEKRPAEGQGGSVYCFIALQDYETKGLGKVKAGDIHKAASWKVPAKHKRGSLYEANYSNACGPYGVVYLRG